MSEQYCVRTVNLETGEETISEPSWRESATVDYAERLAADYFGDETWSEWMGPTLYVGRVFEDGIRSAALVEITVEAETVDEEEDDEEAVD